MVWSISSDNLCKFFLCIWREMDDKFITDRFRLACSWLPVGGKKTNNRHKFQILQERKKYIINVINQCFIAIYFISSNI